MSTEIRKVTVECANGDLVTYRGKGQLIDVNTVQIDAHDKTVKHPIHYISLTLTVESSFAQPLPDGVAQ